MKNAKVTIHNADGKVIGYFIDPEVDIYPESEYELSGRFFEESGQPAAKIEFNPQALPYTADVSQLSGLKHDKLVNVYVQRGRQPVRMSGLGSSG